MAFDPNLFAPGSGIGPQGSGYAPTPADAMTSELRRESAMQLMQYSVYSSPQARTIQGTLARGLAGNAAMAQGFMNTSAGAMVRDASAALVQSGLVPGGNPANLAYAVQNMIASQGFRLGGNAAAGGQLFGSGAVNDTLSLKMFDRLRNSFFDATTGLAKGGAYGMDMSSMGQAISLLNNRGAFAGQKIGSTNYFSNPEQIKQAIQAATREGGQEDYINDLKSLLTSGRGQGFATKVDKNAFKKVADTIKSYTVAMNDAREVFGDMALPQLTQAAERLVGSTVAEAGSPAIMQNRLSALKSVAPTFNMTAGALANATLNNITRIQNALMTSAMNNPLNTAQPYAQIGLNESIARASASVGFGAQMASLPASAANTEYARAMAAKGVYVREFSSADITASTSAGTTALMKEGGNRYAAVAMRAMGQGFVTGASKDKINELLGRLNGATSRGETDAIGAQIKDELARAGIKADAILRTESMESIMGGMSLQDVERFTDINRSQYHARSYNAVTQMRNTGQDAGLLNTEGKRKNFFKLMSTLDTPSLMGALGAVGEGGVVDKKKLSALFASNPALNKYFKQDELAGILSSMGASGTQLTAMTAAFKGNAMTADLVSKMDADATEGAALQNYISSISLGSTPLSKEGLLTMGIRGIFNKGKISDAALMQYAANAKDGGMASIGMNENYTELRMKEGDIGALENSLGSSAVAGLYAEFGIKPGDKAGLAAAMSKGGKGLNAIRKLQGENVYTAAGGKLNILGAAGKDRAFKALEKDVILGQARTLLGDESFGANADLNSVKGREAFNSEVSAKLLADPSKLVDLAKKAEVAGYSGQLFESIAAESKKNPLFLEALNKQEEELRNTKTNDSIQSANSLRGLKNAVAAQSGGNQFLGVLQFATENLATLNLYQKN